MHVYTMNAEDITIEILGRAINEALPNQIGPDEPLERISIYAELIEANYLTGCVMLDEVGQSCNIGGARITAMGREHFHKLQKERADKKSSAKLKKLLRALAKWALGIITALIIAIAGKWLLQMIGLSK
jgi:hypothetical protein